MFTYSFNGSSSPRVVSFVNLLPVDNGGTHVQIFFDILKEYFLKERKPIFKFLTSDVLAGLSGVYSRRSNETRIFRSNKKIN